MIAFLTDAGGVYMARELDAEQADALGCPGANAELTGENTGAQLVVTVAETGRKARRIPGHGGCGIRGTFTGLTELVTGWIVL